MEKTFRNADGKSILRKMVQVIQDNREYLGKVDGAIGDGDHGANMNKGFTRFLEKYKDENYGFTEGLSYLGMVLLNEIGGSMGPIYGTFFLTMAEEGEGRESIGLEDLSSMLDAARKELFALLDAREGDKTLMDCLIPAVRTLEEARRRGADFGEALDAMCEAAERGKESTRELTARYGRASRLGERSKGVLDAGAVSCSLLLKAMTEGITELLGDREEKGK